MPNDYTAEIEVPVSAGTAAAAIWDDLEIWWSLRVDRAKDAFTVRFHNSHASFTREPGGSDTDFNWICTDANMIIEGVHDSAEWVGTRLIWQITDTSDGSRVRFTHEGLNETLECIDACTGGWQKYFEHSLKEHLSGGTPTPETS